MSKIDKLIENGVKSLMIENLEEKAVSKNQQQFMGMVHAYKKGEMKDAPASVKKAAKGMTKKAAKDFASTKHKGLPTRVDESVIGDILIIAGENNTYEKFTAELIKQKYIMPDELQDPETEKELRDMYDAVADGEYGGMNEATIPKQELIAKKPDWAKYIAQHANGEWWYYDDVPRIVSNIGWKSKDWDGYQFGSNIKTDPTGWQTSYEKLNENKMSTKTESIVKRLKEDTEYQKFFKSAMDKFGIKSPADLKGDKKKKEFFDYVDQNYKAKSESLNEDFFAAHSSDNPETREAITQLNNTFKALQNQYKVPTRVLDTAVDLVNQLVEQGYEDGRAEVEGML